LRINGEETKLRGGCIHQDHGIIGGIEHKEMTYRRIRKLKEAGYNAIRCAHFPTSRTVLEACDELGMLVMLELCDAWTAPKVEGDYSCEFRSDWKQDTEDMVRLAYNHPSVIIYSIGNEICEVSDPHEVQYGRKISDLIRSLDQTRYTVNSINMILAMLDKIPELAVKAGVDINSILNGNMEELYKVLMSDEMEKPLEEAFSQTDIAGYNYAEFRYETDIRKYPQRIILGTECYPAALYENWQLCMKHPQIIGDFGWAAWDYLGEAGVGQLRYGEADSNDLYGKYPWRSAGCGDFDLIGNRRPVSYWREIVWGLRKEPYIAVQDPAHYGEKQAPTKWGWSDAERRWNYRGQEGNPVTVEVYSDADEVELYINERLIGKEKTVCDKAFFTAVFEPGIIRAVNFRKGQPAETDELVSASYDVHVEQKETAEGIIEFTVVDDSGILNPDVTVKVTVSKENNPELLGLGSADPESDEDYFGRTIKTWQGRAVAVIRGTGKLEIEAEYESDELH
jgi:beta-galactosidase